MTNSVIKRYTPPTCTLEITAKSSPLSRWVGQSVVKDLQFELRFDDPRKSDESRIGVRGDRTGLEKLCDAVTTYVQDFLLSSSSQLPLSNFMSHGNEEGESLGNLLTLTLSVNRSESVISPSSEGADMSDDSPDLYSKSETSKLRKFPGQIYLSPKGLVSHNLFLGQLANEESGPVVELSVLQLFDLATALDEYATQMVALPNLKQTRQPKTPPAWSWIAASMILAVGVTATTLKWRNQPKSTQQAAAPQAQQPTPTPTIAQAPIPSPPSPLPTPITPTPIALAPKILPPIPVQPPGVPLPNSTPVPQAQNQAPQRQGIAIPGGQPASQTVQTGKVPTLGQNTPPRQVPTLGQNTPPRQVPTLGQNTPPRQVPTLGQNTPPRQVPTLGQPPARKVPSNLSNQAQNPQNQPPSLRKLPSIKTSPSPPEIATGDIASSTANRSISPTAPVTLPSPESATTSAPPKGRLFDQTPQVAEARSYLQSRWKPPADLTKRLEYRIMIGLDGSIERIIPLGEAASIYIDRTNIPAIGQRFVSPPEGSNNRQIRVVLNPDGSVETFLDN
ncbi:DUF4335 domain-containing protein [Limnofasciculus baicalensis]|uniref:DUF4335 domain-containing protein n=1 Tax=Limnofasciculus baicalensis BBK-W-15 TaxID=2699891 RepID=A0AAE3KUK7_9CYAN|nr:DUF4335 domain-containing protein [Limnofasciculus baicalensis]MCP2731627.1 DUF4335 domain-containing protein [Limnofasciculus baicalensis BBK-W-15]